MPDNRPYWWYKENGVYVPPSVTNTGAYWYDGRGHSSLPIGSTPLGKSLLGRFADHDKQLREARAESEYFKKCFQRARQQTIDAEADGRIALQRAEKAEKELADANARTAALRDEHALQLNVIRANLLNAHRELEDLEEIHSGCAQAKHPKPRRTINPSAALAWLKAQPRWWMSGDVDGFRVSCSGRAWLEHPAPTLTAAIIKLRAAMRKAGKL